MVRIPFCSSPSAATMPRVGSHMLAAAQPGSQPPALVTTARGRGDTGHGSSLPQSPADARACPGFYFWLLFFDQALAWRSCSFSSWQSRIKAQWECSGMTHLYLLRPWSDGELSRQLQRCLTSGRCKQLSVLHDKGSNMPREKCRQRLFNNCSEALTC